MTILLFVLESIRLRLAASLLHYPNALFDLLFQTLPQFLIFAGAFQRLVLSGLPPIGQGFRAFLVVIA